MNNIYKTRTSQKKYKLSKAEEETILYQINFDEESSEATVYTTCNTLIKKLNGYCKKGYCSLVSEDEYSSTFKIPKHWIMIEKVKPPKPEKVKKKKKKTKSKTKNKAKT